MLLGNRSVIRKSPLRYFSGTTLSGDRCNFGGSGAIRNRFFGGFSPLFGGLPSGHLWPSSWSMPQTAGAVSAFTTCRGSGVLNIAMASGIGISGQADGAVTVAGTGASLSWGTGAAAGSGAASGQIVGLAYLTGASSGTSTPVGLLFASVNIQGTAAGSSSLIIGGSLAMSISGLAAGSSELLGAMSALSPISGSAAGSASSSGIITGAFFAQGASYGMSEVTGGELEGYGWISGTGPGASTGSVNPYAVLHMDGTTNVVTELTADAVAQAVWNYEQ